MTTLGATLVDLNPATCAGQGRRGQRRRAARWPRRRRAGLRRARAVRSRSNTSRVHAAARRNGGRSALRRADAGDRSTPTRWPRLAEAQTRHPGADFARTCYALVPILVASWALGGLYLSLGPSVAASLFGLTNHLVGGLVVTLLCATGAVTAFTTEGLADRPGAADRRSIAHRRHGDHPARCRSSIRSCWRPPAPAIAGIGFGASALACFGTLARLAAPEERGELFAVAFVISYLAFSLPAVVAGFAATVLRAAWHCTGLRTGGGGPRSYHPGRATTARS